MPSRTKIGLQTFDYCCKKYAIHEPGSSSRLILPSRPNSNHRRQKTAHQRREEDMASRCRPKTPVQEPTPSEAPARATEPSSLNLTGPPPPPEYMATRWTKTWRSLFHWWRAAPTKQAPPGTNLILLPSTKSEKKKTPPPRRSPSPQQQRRSTLTDGPGRTIGSKRSHHEVREASNAQPADYPSRRRQPHRHT